MDKLLLKLDQANMILILISQKSKRLIADGVYQRRKKMTKLDYQDSLKHSKRTLVLENTTNSSSLLEWKWWKEYCSKRPSWKIRTEVLTIIKNWYKSYLQKPRVSMLPKKRNTLWGKSTWLVEYNLEPIKICLRRVTSGKSRNRIISNSLAPQTPKLKQIISLITKTKK